MLCSDAGVIGTAREQKIMGYWQADRFLERVQASKASSIEGLAEYAERSADVRLEVNRMACGACLLSDIACALLKHG